MLYALGNFLAYRLYALEFFFSRLKQSDSLVGGTMQKKLVIGGMLSSNSVIYLGGHSRKMRIGG
jgi:hypothetical protein